MAARKRGPDAGHSIAGIARTLNALNVPIPGLTRIDLPCGTVWGHGGIARTLNALNVPPPSAHDLARNPPRCGTAWTLRTIAAILANPRYTGRQVWRRQSIDHHESTGDKSSRPRGSKPTRSWNPRDRWSFRRRARTRP